MGVPPTLVRVLVGRFGEVASPEAARSMSVEQVEAAHWNSTLEVCLPAARGCAPSCSRDLCMPVSRNTGAKAWTIA